MSLKEILAALNIVEYPPALEAYYPIAEERKGELCSLALIDRLQEQFQLFGPYYPEVRAGFEDLEKDPLRKACMDVYSLYLKDSSTQQARELKCPSCVSTPASNMLPLLIHLPSVENTYQILLDRGFPQKAIRGTMDAYRIYLWEVKEFRKGFAGLTPAISRWLTYITKVELFYPGFCGLNYQITALDQTAPVVLKNRNTGQIMPVFGNHQMFHRSGVPLGSAGADDTDGSFEAVYEETETAFIGHPTEHYRVSAKRKQFSKEEWEIALRPGDDVIGIHLFFQTDLTPEIAEQSLEAGLSIARHCFPERNFKAFHCSSWLLSPVLNEVLGENAKLSAFSSRFVRFPALSPAKSVFPYVFPGKYESHTDLPENTSLQRGLKQRILAGEYIYDTRGVILL